MSEPWKRREQIGDCTLYLGDALEVLPTLGEVDAVVTDPPYGVGFSGKIATQRGGGQTKGIRGYETYDDTPENVQKTVIPVLSKILRKSKRGAITPGTRCMFMYPQPVDVGCFFSAAGTGVGRWGFTCSQPIFFYGKDPYLERGLGSRANSLGQTYPNDANQVGHPCAKPLPQMKWLVQRTSLEHEKVLDPFMGSGTTGVACVQLGRRFIGVEIEEKYFNIACRRIDEATRQGRLFDLAPSAPTQESLDGV